MLHEILGEIVALADRALRNPVPWEGFRAFAERYVRLRATSCGLNEALAGSALSVGEPVAVIRTRLRKLVERAQSAGAIRTDVTWRDVAFLLAAVLPGDHTLGLRTPKTQWRRNLDLALDGLRPR